MAFWSDFPMEKCTSIRFIKYLKEKNVLMLQKKELYHKRKNYANCVEFYFILRIFKVFCKREKWF